MVNNRVVYHTDIGGDFDGHITVEFSYTAMTDYYGSGFKDIQFLSIEELMTWRNETQLLPMFF